MKKLLLSITTIASLSMISTSTHALMTPKRWAQCLFMPKKNNCTQKEIKEARIGTAVAATAIAATGAVAGGLAAASKKESPNLVRDLEKRKELLKAYMKAQKTLIDTLNELGKKYSALTLRSLTTKILPITSEEMQQDLTKLRAIYDQYINKNPSRLLSEGLALEKAPSLIYGKDSSTISRLNKEIIELRDQARKFGYSGTIGRDFADVSLNLIDRINWLLNSRDKQRKDIPALEKKGIL